MTEAHDASKDVAFANRLANWLHKANVPTTELSVDFADIVSAARALQVDLDTLLTLDVRQPDQADAALECLGRVHAWLFTEIKYHLQELENAWPELEERIAALTPDSE